MAYLYYWHQYDSPVTFDVYETIPGGLEPTQIMTLFPAGIVDYLPFSCGAEGEDMESTDHDLNAGFLIKTVLLSLLAVIGFDLFLHAGILSPLYDDPGPFLLPSETAFKLIPLGYLAFAILNVMLAWLMVRLEIFGLTAGFRFGIQMGFLIWVSLALGLASITSAPLKLLVGWVAGQTIEMGLAGAVLGAGFKSRNLKKLSLWCLVIFLICVVLGIVIQNILSR